MGQYRTRLRPGTVGYANLLNIKLLEFFDRSLDPFLCGTKKVNAPR